MVKFLLLTQILILLILTASCGQKPMPRNLIVSAGFAVSSSNFPGGLVVTAENSKGEKITHTALGGDILEFNLTADTWKFYVVGWTGTTPMTGSTLCNASTHQITESTKDVNINVTSQDCSDAVFKPTSGYAADTTGLMKVNIKSCSHLYENLSTLVPISPATSTSLLSTGFCNAGNNADIVRSAKSYSVKIKGMNSVIASSCILSSSSEFRLPTNKIPVQIELYGNIDCTGEKVDLNFSQGIANAASSLDGNETISTVFIPSLSTTGSTYLVMPFNIVWSGHSPLMSLLPSFVCNSGAPCSSAPSTLPSQADYIINNEGEITLSRGTDCSKILITSPVGLTVGQCRMNDDNATVRITKTATSCMTLGQCSFSLNINNGTSVIKNVFELNQTQATNFQNMNNIYQLTGVSQVSSVVADSMWSFRDGNFAYGRISRAREMLSSDGPMGAFGNTTCSALNGEKVLTRFVDGALRMFKIIARDDNQTLIPLSLADDSNPYATARPAGKEKFQKTIVFRELVNGGYVTKDIIRLRCDSKIGLIETQEFDSEGAEKRIIGWNTQILESARFYHWESNFNVNEQRLYVDSSQSVRFANNRVLSSSVTYHKGLKNNTSEEENANSNIYYSEQVSGNEVIHHQMASINSASHTSVFNRPTDKLLKSIPELGLNINNLTNKLEDYLAYVEENGSKFILAVEGTSLNLYYKIATTPWQTQSVATAVTHKSPRLLVNGNKIFLSWLSNNGSTEQINFNTVDISTALLATTKSLILTGAASSAPQITFITSLNKYFVSWIEGSNVNYTLLTSDWSNSPSSNSLTFPATLFSVEGQSYRIISLDDGSILGFFVYGGEASYFKLNPSNNFIIPALDTISGFNNATNIELIKDGSTIILSGDVYAQTTINQVYTFDGSSLDFIPQSSRPTTHQYSSSNCFKSSTLDSTSCTTLPSLMSTKELERAQTIEALNPTVFETRFTNSSQFSNFNP